MNPVDLLIYLLHFWGCFEVCSRFTKKGHFGEENQLEASKIKEIINKFKCTHAMEH